MRIAFFGSDAFSVSTFEAFTRECKSAQTATFSALLSNTRGKFADFAKQKAINCINLSKGVNWRDAIDQNSWDVGLVASFGRFIPAWFQHECIQRRFILNVHPSMLPFLRGPAPIQHALNTGLRETGVSIIDLDGPTFDSGKIWHSQTLPIDPSDDYKSLMEKCALLGGCMAGEIVDNWDAFCPKRSEQTGTITFAPKITSRDARIDLQTHTSTTILNRYRGISHQRHLHSDNLVPGRTVYLHSIDVEASGLFLKGRYFHDNALLHLRCADSRSIAVSQFTISSRPLHYSASEMAGILRQHSGKNRFSNKPLQSLSVY